MSFEADTNILLDLLGSDHVAQRDARTTLHQAVDTGGVIVCSVVYAELGACFADPREAERFLTDLQIQREEFETASLQRAATAWRDYTRRHSRTIECPQCGNQIRLQCPNCQSPIVRRQHLITNFLIGAHAVVQSTGLITRDLGYFRTYFPELRLIVPGRDVP